MTENVYTLLYVLNNPVIRMLIKSSSEICPSCGKSHLDIVFNDYVNVDILYGG